MKVSHDFDIREFVSPETWKKHGYKSIRFIDQRVIFIAQLLRSISAKPVIINNWHYSHKHKIYTLSGYRPPDTKIGVTESQHKFGRAIDVKVVGMTAQEVYDLVLDNLNEFISIGLTTIEDIRFTPTWNHLDCRNSLNKDELLIIKP